jgi:microcystin-dependent protein
MGAVPFLGLSGSTLAPVTAYAGTPGPGQPPSPWLVNGSTVSYSEGGAVVPVAVPGGDKGKGSFNAEALYVNGVPVALAGGAEPPSGPAGGDLSGSYPNPTIKPDVALTGNPTAPTPATSDNDASIATTAFTKAAIASGIAAGAPPIGAAGGDLTGNYPNPTIKVDVALTGNPTAPTPAAGDSDTSIATTKFVHDAIFGGAGAFTSGSVIFAGATGGLTQDNPNFSWDDTNNRLGVGVAAPLTALHIRGAGQVNANYDPSVGQGAAVYVNDTGSAVGTGGAMVFGDSFGWFGSIKGYAQSGTGPVGALIVGLRKLGTDTTFTEAVRFQSDGSLIVATGLATGYGTFNQTVKSQATVAVPAGGTADVGLLWSSTAHLGIVFGSGVPNKVQAQGTWYQRTDANATNPPLYYNIDGTATGWIPFSSGGTVAVGTTPPVAPADNSLWFYSDAVNGGGTLYIRYNDGNTVQWVPASPAPAGQAVPPGSIMDFAGLAAPTGWLLCQGQLVSRTAFPGLFAAIGTAYGAGDGSTNFAVPDLGGRVVAGTEAVATRLTTAISGVNGAQVGAVGGDQSMPVHTHTASGAGLVGNNLTNGTTRAVGTADGINSGFYQNVNVSVSNSGVGVGANVQPTMIMNKIIKT